jgi:molybdopterin synthase sulfur carrier subunit
VAVVHLPALLSSLTQGDSQPVVTGTTVGELVDQLEIRYPGIKKRLLDGDRLRPDLAVFVDGSVRRDGLKCEVSADSEVHFIPAIAGG